MLRISRGSPTRTGVAPIAAWFSGPAGIGRFPDALWCVAPENVKFVRITANDQPVVAWWQRDGAYQAHCVQMLTVTSRG
ncbi:hypothetical protein H4W33_007375 [Kibdelosporangium phytohabitans]|nr:hypothetical protein [Kibdelosporangium phytohabitans]